MLTPRTTRFISLLSLCVLTFWPVAPLLATPPTPTATPPPSDLSADEAPLAEGSGGLLAFFLGLPMKKALGVSRGDIREFTLQRVRITDAAMSGKPADKTSTVPDNTFLTFKEVVVDYDVMEIVQKRMVRSVVVKHPQIWISQIAPASEPSKPSDSSSPAPIATPTAPSSPQQQPLEFGQSKVRRDTDAMLALAPAAPSTPAPQKTEPKKSEEKTAAKKEAGMLVQHLEIHDAVVHLDTLRHRGISVPLSLAREKPIVFENFLVGDPSSSPDADTMRELAVEDILVNSAFGPLAPLLQIDSITVRFSFRGLAERRVESLVIEKPLIFVGNDWFMLLDEFGKATPPSPTPASAENAGSPPFTLGHFQIRHLGLALSSFGLVDMQLPFGFAYDARNVRLDNNGNFFLQSNLSVEEKEFTIPEVLSVTGLEGDIKFNWPPKDNAKGNIVPTLKAASLAFVETPARKRIEISQPWVSFTLQRQGDDNSGLSLSTSDMSAFLNFGATVNQGYLNGGLNTTLDSYWKTWINGARLDLQVLNLFTAQVISGNFDARMEAAGKGMKIEEGSKIVLKRVDRNAEITLNLAGSVDDFFRAEEITTDMLTAGASEKDLIAALVLEQRKRTGEVQRLKNERAVGENNKGYLESRLPAPSASTPVSPEVSEAQKVIKAENEARKTIYSLLAKKQGVPISKIEKTMGERWSERAFPGEWVQTTPGRWLRK